MNGLYFFFGVLLNLVTFLENSRNRLGALKARQATHASRTHFLGFLLCTAWRLGAVRQATQIGLPNSLGFLVFQWCGDVWSNSYDMRIIGML